MVTIREIAQRASVSIRTVSGVLNNSETLRVSDGTRKRVLSIAEEMGYRPNLTARNLRLGNIATIALVVTSNPLGQFDVFIAFDVVRGVEGVVHNVSARLITYPVAEGQTQEAVSLIKSGALADGYVVVWEDFLSPVVEQCKLLNIPHGVYDDRKGIGDYSVVADDSIGTYQAAEHLVKLGHRRVGMISSVCYRLIRGREHSGTLWLSTASFVMRA